MKTVTMVEFRRHAADILDRVRKGQRILLTYRGNPAVVMEPATSVSAADDDDRFYELHLLSGEAGETLSNREIDDTIYDL